jgi:ABC-type nitrate/sulfonate/bicarbonate transport system substrate-binding protein
MKEEGIDVRLLFQPNAGDSITALKNSVVDIIHNPFTATYVNVDRGADLKIISGSGDGGLMCLASKKSGIQSLDDLKKRAGKGLTVGTQRINTLEMVFYRVVRNLGLTYKDFDVKYYPDHFALLSAFKSGDIDVVTHVEPYNTMLLNDTGAKVLATSDDVWGKGSPDCVVSVRSEYFTKNSDLLVRYVRALLKADSFIKSNLEESVRILNEGHFYKVDERTLRESIPRQMPGVDLRKGAQGMETAVEDMVEAKYLTKKPAGVMDLSLLQRALG